MATRRERIGKGKKEGAVLGRHMFYAEARPPRRATRVHPSKGECGERCVRAEGRILGQHVGLSLSVKRLTPVRALYR